MILHASISRRLIIIAVPVLVLLCLTNQSSPAQDKWPDYNTLDSVYTYRDSLRADANGRLLMDSNDVIGWSKLIRVAKEEKQFERELELALYAQNRLPQSAQICFHVGDAMLDNGLTEESIPVFRSGLRLEPKHVRMLTTLAEAYDLLYMTDSALYFLDSAISISPRYVQAHYQKAELLDRVGRKLEAIESYTNWANLQPLTAEPWIQLGTVHCVVAQYDEALEVFNYALSLKPDSPEALYQKGVALQGLGRRDEAREAFVDFFFRFPKNEHAIAAEEMARSLGWSP